MADLDARATTHPWTRGQYAESINNHSCWLLEEEGRVAGFIVYSSVVDEVELLNVVVDPLSQGRGYGRRLLELLFDRNREKARACFLEVRESNTRACALYEKMGFTCAGRRKHYYPAAEGREDALIMCYEFN